MKCKICKKHKSSFQPSIQNGELIIDICRDCFKKEQEAHALNKKVMDDFMSKFF